MHVRATHIHAICVSVCMPTYTVNAKMKLTNTKCTFVTCTFTCTCMYDVRMYEVWYGAYVIVHVQKIYELLHQVEHFPG